MAQLVRLLLPAENRFGKSRGMKWGSRFSVVAPKQAEASAGEWAERASSFVKSVGRVSLHRLSVFALVAAAACGASESPDKAGSRSLDAPESVGTSRAALSTFTEDFDSADVLLNGGDDLEVEDRAALHESIREGIDDMEAGRTVDAKTTIAKLRSRL
jgi:hypothetical protein